MAFELKGWSEGAPAKYVIYGERANHVMGVNCPECDAWTTAGSFDYPSVEVSRFDDTVLAKLRTCGRKDLGPMDLGAFDQLAKKIETAMGGGRRCAPGTGFGPLRGAAAGRFTDFTWMGPGTLLVLESVFAKLQEEQLPLIGVEAELNFKQQNQEKLIELEVWATASLHQSQSPPKCELCGRQLNSVPVRKSTETTRIDAKTYDENLPLQRIHDNSAIVANEPMAELIRRFDWSGVKLVPVELH